MAMEWEEERRVRTQEIENEDTGGPPALSPCFCFALEYRVFAWLNLLDFQA